MPKTTARKTSDGWRISGTKIYSTGSTGLRWYAVWAKTDELQTRVGVFLVRAGSPGIRIEPAWDHLGMRATVSHEVSVEDTPVPPELAVDLRLGDRCQRQRRTGPVERARANAIKAVELGLQHTGNPGLSRKNPLERHYRDVLCSRIHAPQNDLILVGAGRKALGV